MQPDERTAFLGSLIGKPYKIGAEGPHEYDCYGLARLVLANVFGAHLPARRGAVSLYRGCKRVAGPVDGALVMMDNGTGRHVGVWLDPEGGCIHALDGVGVIFEHLPMLEMRGYSCKYWTVS